MSDQQSWAEAYNQEELEKRIRIKLDELAGDLAKKAKITTEENGYGPGPCAEIDGGVSIAWQADESCWVVDKITYDPGVRYYKDGSGQPPSWDYATVLTTTDLDEAIQSAVETWIKETEEIQHGW